jgi:hypothetical protein
MSISAYHRRQEAAEKPRELERRAFSIVIGKLVGGKAEGGKRLIEACYLNYQLWSTLQADLVLQDNALPTDLKAADLAGAMGAALHARGDGRHGLAGPADRRQQEHPRRLGRRSRRRRGPTHDDSAARRRLIGKSRESALALRPSGYQAKRLRMLPPLLLPLRKERSTPVGGTVGSGMLKALPPG